MKVALRARRRAARERMRARTLRVMRLWHGRGAGPVDLRDLGVKLSTHCRPCGCWMCQTDAREVPRRRERAAYWVEADGDAAS